MKGISSPFGVGVELGDGKERRFRARQSRGYHHDDSCEVETPSAHSPLDTEATSILARAEVMLATEDLDRLSEMARKHKESE